MGGKTEKENTPFLFLQHKTLVDVSKERIWTPSRGILCVWVLFSWVCGFEQLQRPQSSWAKLGWISGGGRTYGWDTNEGSPNSERGLDALLRGREGRVKLPKHCPKHCGTVFFIKKKRRKNTCPYFPGPYYCTVSFWGLFCFKYCCAEYPCSCLISFWR